MEFKALLPDPSKNQQGVLWHYTQDKKTILGIWANNAEWKLLNGFDTTQSKLQGRRLTVATLPAIKLTTESKINGSVAYLGLYIDYLNLVADYLKFTYVTYGVFLRYS